MREAIAPYEALRWLHVGDSKMIVAVPNSGASRINQSGVEALREFPNFPIGGILFKDIAPMLAGRGALGEVVSTVASQVSGTEIDAILAVDARGFILGASLADRLGCGFIMVRKPGKLPGDVLSFEYSCEYCSGTLEVTAGLIGDGLRCLIADDLLATGGTARATGNFVKSQGGEIAGYAFILEIEVLKGRRQLDDAPVISAMTC